MNGNCRYQLASVVCFALVQLMLHADQFHIKDVPLPIVTSCRDLGITSVYTSNLSFNEHIKDIVAIHAQHTDVRCQ